MSPTAELSLDADQVVEARPETVFEELVTTVSFELEPQGTNTRLTVNHRGFVDPIDLEQNQTFWIHHLSGLTAVAAGEEPTA